MLKKFSLRLQTACLLGLLALIFGFGTAISATAEVPALGFQLSGSSRLDVLALYHVYYGASEGFAARMGWNGNVTRGIAGQTSDAFKNDVLRRINFYRVLAGLQSNIVFDPGRSAQDQQACLMFSANSSLSHDPPLNWKFRTGAAVNAALNSLLSLGRYGPPAIDDYMLDDGLNNELAGHRRWLLYSDATLMGTGDIPTNNQHFGSNAVWVLGGFRPHPTPEQNQIVTWPSPGYFPLALLPKRWSFAVTNPNTNFDGATVTMKVGETPIWPVTVVSRSTVGLGDPTLVWEVPGLPKTIPADTTYTVTIAGVGGKDLFSGTTYSVTVFDPQVLDPANPANAVPVAGPEVIPASGGFCTTLPIGGASAYQLRVARRSSVRLLGGDASPVPVARDASFQTVSPGLAYHLTFPGPAFENQILSIVEGGNAVRKESNTRGVYREFLPGSKGALFFFDLCRFASPTTTLGAEVSTDNGNTWTVVWKRRGVGLKSTQWDGYSQRRINLARFAGRSIAVRFVLRYNDAPTVLEPGPNGGFYVNGISLTGCSELVRPKRRDIDLGAATAFHFNSTVAGEQLRPGALYYLRIQPILAEHQFGYGPFKIIRVVR